MMDRRKGIVVAHLLLRKYYEKDPCPCFFLLSGCSSTPISFEKAPHVPEKRVFNTPNASLEHQGKIVVVRNSAFQLAGCPFLITVNSTPLASLQNDEKFIFYVNEEEQVMSVGMDLNYSNFCSAFGIEKFTTIETRVKPNEVKYWRIDRERLIRDIPKVKLN